MPLSDFLDISENDTVWDAWLNTLTLLDMLEEIPQLSQHYDFQQARNRIAKMYLLAESHAIDKKINKCVCGLSDAEHALLKRKMLRFFKLQMANLKHFIC
jgi:hypothetical protein